MDAKRGEGKGWKNDEGPFSSRKLRGSGGEGGGEGWEATREIRRTKKKQRPSTTGASTIYGRTLLSLFRIGYGASGPMLGKSETYTRGLGRYVV